VHSSQFERNPFGMMMPGRNLQSTIIYRYSINGQEKSSEIGLNTTTAEFWQFDTKIARRLNIDPKPVTYISVFAAFENNPIWNSDPLGDSIAPNRTKGFNVFIVPTKEMRENDDGAYKADYKKIKKMERSNPGEVIVIESDNPEKAISDLKEKLGENGFVRNMLIDYHAGSFGNYALNSSESRSAMKSLADGYIGNGSVIYLGNCWAGGAEKDQGYTKSYAEWSDKATVYGGKTEAKSAGFKIFGDFTRMAWTLHFTPNGKSENVKEIEKKFAGQHGVSFYSTVFKTIVSVDIKKNVKFNTNGSIHGVSTSILQDTWEKSLSNKLNSIIGVKWF